MVGDSPRNRWRSDRFYPAYASRVRQLTQHVPDAGEIPVGRWKVVFSNGVVQTCSIDEKGKVSVTQTGRTASGKVSEHEDSISIQYADDRAERWVVKDGGITVEHWHPASQMPNGPAVLGKAIRTGPSTKNLPGQIEFLRCDCRSTPKLLPMKRPISKGRPWNSLARHSTPRGKATIHCF